MTRWLRRALPHGLRQRVKSLIGEQAFRHCNAPHPRLGLAAMRDRGFEPRTILDVGSYKGRWAEMAHRVWPDARIAMVEPNAAREPDLRRVADRIGGSWRIALAGAEDGAEVPFTVLETGSSVFEPCNSYPRETELRRLARLDTLFSDWPGADFIKIDAQGYELEILKGAARLMPTAGAILLEVSLIQINRGAPLLHDVVSFMQAQGFLTYDIVEMHRRPRDGATAQIDMVFVPATSPLLASRSFD